MEPDDLEQYSLYGIPIQISKEPLLPEGTKVWVKQENDTGKYILDDDGNPVHVEDILVWSKWYEKNMHRRVVARTKIGKVTVSTVFLALDHGFYGGPPVLWETMTFSDDREDGMDGYMERYTSKADAQAGHARICQMVEDGVCPGEQIKEDDE